MDDREVATLNALLASGDVIVIGGGLVGLGTGMALAARGLRVVVLEAEDRVAAHQSGHNSGVIHSGLYYKPGSLKAALCVAGREALYRFCAEEGIAHRRCGKLVVATSEDELPALAEIERRGHANGLLGVRRLDGEAAIREIEPHAAGIAALWVPETGIVDFPAVARAYARWIEAAGGEVLTGARALAVRRDGTAGSTSAAGVVVETPRGRVRGSLLVNCAGLQADRVARMCGVRPRTRIVPFRGEYWELAPTSRERVRGLIYPVPDARFPFLGVHLTTTVGGEVEAGPNAVLTWKREGYRRGAFSARDAADLLTFPGFWWLVARYWRTGVRELWRAAAPGALARDLRRLVPALTAAELHRAGSGVRAMEVDRRGRMIDDFHLLPGLPGDRAVHVLNAPSPAATASIAIGEHIAAAALAALAG
jgi:L-2-hydroxyglutarate oxidase